MDFHEQFTKIAYIVVNPLKCFCQSVLIHLYRWPLDRYPYVWTENYQLPNYVERETLHWTKAVLMNNQLGKASGTKLNIGMTKGNAFWQVSAICHWNSYSRICYLAYKIMVPDYLSGYHMNTIW